MRKPGVYAGEEKTGWQVWRVWRDEAVVLILKLGDDQNDLASYTAVFAID